MADDLRFFIMLGSGDSIDCSICALGARTKVGSQVSTSTSV